MVKTFSLISQPISAPSKQDFNHGHISNIYSQQQASHILHMSLWACAINATLQQEMHTFSDTLHPWESLEYLNQF